MPEKRPPPYRAAASTHWLPDRSRPARPAAAAAAVTAEVVEQVVHRLSLVMVAAARELVPRYAEALLVDEHFLRNLLADTAAITEIDLRRHLPADLTFLLHRLVKEEDEARRRSGALLALDVSP